MEHEDTLGEIKSPKPFKHVFTTHTLYDPGLHQNVDSRNSFIFTAPSEGTIN